MALYLFPFQVMGGFSLLTLKTNNELGKFSLLAAGAGSDLALTSQ